MKKCNFLKVPKIAHFFEKWNVIAKKITIPGSDLDIPNSIPGDLTIITNDSGTDLSMEDGALIYFVDINNRVWKVNLLKSSITNNTFGEKKLLYSVHSD